MAKRRAKKTGGESLADAWAALHKAADELPPVVLIVGPEAELRREAVQTLLAAFRQARPGAEITTYRGDGEGGERPPGLADLLQEMDTGSLFASERCLLVRRAEAVLASASGEKEQVEKRFLSLLDAPPRGIWLFLECEAIDRRRTIGKSLVAKCAVVPCPPVTRQADVARWASRAGKNLGKTIDPDVVDLLTRSLGTDLGRLRGEIEKLAAYAGDAKTIARADAEAFLTGSLEFDIFSLTNAVERRQLEPALLFAKRIVDQGLRDRGGRRMDNEAAAQMALAMIARTLEQIVVARVLRGEGAEEADVARTLGIHPFRAKRMLEAAGHFPLGELRRMAMQVARLCRGAHETGGDGRLALERAILACCRRSSAAGSPVR